MRGAAALGAALLALAGCGGDGGVAERAATGPQVTTGIPEATTPAGPPPTVPGTPPTIRIAEREFSFAPERVSASPGEVVIAVRNAGNIRHDLVVEGNGQREQTPLLDPGAYAQLRLDVQPGTYTLYCSVPRHRGFGMEAELAVS